MIVEDLKNSILLSAMKGLLSERKIDDTNIHDTFDLIKIEKENYIMHHSNAKNMKLKDIDEKEIPFEIPNSWKWVRWGILSNSIQYGSNTGALPTGNVKLVRISDIKNNEIDWENVPYSHIKEKEIEQYLLYEKDILFARTGGTVGKSVIVKSIPNDCPYIFAGYLIRSNYSSIVNHRYLKYFMESPLYWEQLKSGTIGSAQPNCNGQTLAKMIIPLPPIEEQQRIVDKIEELFSKLDEIKPIEEEIKNIKNDFSNNIKDSILLNYILGLSKSNKVPLNNYKTIKLPLEWKWERFENLAECRMGKTILSNSLKTSGIPVYSATNTDSVFGYIDNPTLVLKKNDLVIPARGNSIGFATIVKDEIATCTQTTIACFPNKLVNSKYLYYCCYAFKKVWFKYSGSAIPQITISNINKNHVPLPPLEEQQRIVEKLEQLLPLCDDIEKLVKE